MFKGVNMKAIHITVDLEKNNSIDIKAGGPMYFGFDFHISANSNLADVKEKIIKALKKRGLECLCVTTEDPRDFDGKLSTLDDIEHEIQNYKSRGFTVIEMMGVIIVLVILGSLMFKMINRFLM